MIHPVSLFSSSPPYDHPHHLRGIRALELAILANMSIPFASFSEVAASVFAAVTRSRARTGTGTRIETTASKVTAFVVIVISIVSVIVSTIVSDIVSVTTNNFLLFLRFLLLLLLLPYTNRFSYSSYTS